MSNNICVVGLNWGDEGKGQIVDHLTGRFDMVVRYSGGANAGHSVVIDGEKFGLHLVPSGIMHPHVQAVIANGVALDPEVLLDEIDTLAERGVDVNGRLFISDRAHLVLPYHKLQDSLSEQQLQDDKIGTTIRGIGPCYADKANRTTGIRVHHLMDKDIFHARLEHVVAIKNRIFSALYKADPIDVEPIFEEYCAFADRLRPFVTDTVALLHESSDAGKTLLFEGAQGSLLDIDFGTYPFVTSSNSSAMGMGPGSGMPARSVGRYVGVTKAYTSRVGAGPFPSELHDATGDAIRDRGKEYGTTTGRPRRIGWFDGVATRFAVRLGGIDSVALIGLNVLSTLDEISVCTGYRHGDEVLRWYPGDLTVLDNVEPVLETLPGWGKDVGRCSSWDELPERARGFIERISQLVERPIGAVAVGPQRSQLLFNPQDPLA